MQAAWIYQAPTIGQFCQSTDGVSFPRKAGGKDDVISTEERDKMLKEIGSRLRLLRKVKGCTQKEMAGVINAVPTTWSNYEDGKRPISTLDLLEVCDRFGITTEWILRGRTDMLGDELRAQLAGAAMPSKPKRGRPQKKRPNEL